MKLTDSLYKICFLFVILTGQQHVYAEIFPADHLYVGYDILSMRISPKGTFISSWTFIDGKHRIDVFESLGKYSESVSSIRNTDRVGVKSLSWIDDNSLLIEYWNTIVEHTYEIVDIKKVDDQFEFQKTLKTLDGVVVDTLPQIEDSVYFGQKDAKGLQVFQVDLREFAPKDLTKKQKLNKGMDDAFFFLTDGQHRLRIALTKKKKKIFMFYFDLNLKKWKSIMEIDPLKEYFTPQGFINDHSIAVISDQERDRNALFAYDLITGKIEKTVYEDDQYEILSADIDKTTGDVISVKIFKKGRATSQYLRPDGKKFAQMAKKAFPDKEVYIIDRTVDQSKWLLLVSGADDPGKIYHYDVKSHSARPLADRMPSLSGYTLVKNQLIQTVVKDGYKIDSFITLPLNQKEKFPLIVMPHGGPIGVADTDHFDRDVQYYANRGYGVLRINYRGSFGYGKKFLDSGRGEWGRKIEDDIQQIVNEVKTKYKIDKSCIIGASYGGYSALMSIIRFPQQYRCAISIFGVTDIPLLLSTSNKMKNKKRRDAVIQIIGDPKQKDTNHKAVSPVYMADKVQVPVMLIGGGEDRIADLEHTNRMRYMLRAHGKQFLYVAYPTAGHGHLKWTGDIHQSAIIDAFLRRHMDLPLTETLEDKFQLCLEWNRAGEYLFSGNLVKKDLYHALVLFEQALQCKNDNAQFNTAYMYEHGLASTKRPKQALSLYQAAAKELNEKAIYRLAQVYEKGELGVTIDRIKGFNLYKQAADLGHLYAKYDMALALMQGQGTKQDYKASLKLLEELAELDLNSDKRLIKLARQKLAEIKKLISK